VKDSPQAGETKFSFTDLSNGAPAQRDYVMRQTIVRRVKQAGETKPRKARKHTH